MRHGAGLFVRHARPAIPGVCYGQSEITTDPPPRRAADVVRRRLRGAVVDRIHTSPLPRCRLLAERLSALLRRPCSEDPRLVELSFGRWEGQRWDAIWEHDGSRLDRWATSYTTVAPPGGETALELEARVASFLADLDPSEAVLVVGHAGVLRALWVVARERSWPEALRAPIPHLEPLPFAADPRFR